VLSTVTSGCRGTNGPSSIRDIGLNVSAVFEVGAEARLNELPSSGILWLFLGPDLRGVDEALGCRSKRPEGEGSELLDTNDGDIVDGSLLPGGFKVVEDLSRTIHNFPDFLVSHQGLMSVVEDPLEAETGLELVDVGASSSELEELLRGDHDQRLTEVTTHLSAEQMEVLRGSSAVGDDDVGLFHNVSLRLVLGRRRIVGVRKLQETFYTGRRVLRTIAVIPVRQQHHQSMGNVPLGLA